MHNGAHNTSGSSARCSVHADRGERPISPGDETNTDERGDTSGGTSTIAGRTDASSRLKREDDLCCRPSYQSNESASLRRAGANNPGHELGQPDCQRANPSLWRATSRKTGHLAGKSGTRASGLPPKKREVRVRERSRRDSHHLSFVATNTPSASSTSARIQT